MYFFYLFVVNHYSCNPPVQPGVEEVKPGSSVYTTVLTLQVGAERIGRCAAPNDDPTFISCLTDIVATHLKSGEKVAIRIIQILPFL